MGTNDSAVDHLDFPVHLPSRVGAFLNTGEQFGPNALLLPAVKPGTDGFPIPIPFRKVTPWTSRTLDPENAVQDGAVIEGRSPGAGPLWGKQWSQLAPLLVSQLITSYHTSFYSLGDGLQTQPSPCPARIRPRAQVFR